MSKSDSKSKRSVPSPRPVSLSEAMGREKPPGFGETTAVKVDGQNPHNAAGGGGRTRGGTKKQGVSSRTNYDVKTRVKLGGGKKKK